MVLVIGHTKCGAIGAAREFNPVEHPAKENDSELIKLVRNIRAALDSSDKFGRWPVDNSDAVDQICGPDKHGKCG